MAMITEKTQFDFATYIEDFRIANECETLADINNGLCGDFAFLLNEAMEQQGLPTFEILTLFEFSNDLDFPENTAHWSLKKLKSYGVTKSEYADFYSRLPQGEDDDPDRYVGYHIWLYDGEKHYDCENMEGVVNPLQLPFFQRQLKGADANAQ